jgi:hypothetical protein
MVRSRPTLTIVVRLRCRTCALTISLRLTHVQLVISAPAAIHTVCVAAGATMFKLSTDGNAFPYCELFAERRQYDFR